MPTLSVAFLQSLDYPGKLPKRERTRLVNRWRKHQDTQALHKLALSVMPWVIRRAMKYVQPGDDPSDLISEALLGAMESIKNYDPKYSLTTYAAIHVHKRIMAWLENNRYPLRVPRYFHKPPPKAKPPGQACLLAYETVRDAHTEPVEHLEQWLEDSNSPDPVQEAMRREGPTRLEQVQRAMDCFQDIRLKEVLQARLKGERLQAIADRMGICKERVRQLQAKAIHRVRKLLDLAKV